MFVTPFLIHMKLTLLLVLWLGLALPAASQVLPTSFSDSNLPIVLIDTDGSTIVDDPKIMARMRIIDRGAGQRNSISDSPNQYKGLIGIELRGSSSQWMPKKSYGLETLTHEGAELDTTLLGMPAEHDWVLTANYADKTLLRNTFTYTIASELGQYASRNHYCELVLNGEYQGVYVLGEKIKRGSKRVNISKLKSTDVSGDAVTGGYLLKLDKLTGEPAGGFLSKHTDTNQPDYNNKYIQIEYPKPKDLAPAQLDYISAYVDSFEVALAGPDFADPEIGYRRYLDVKSFIDYFLLTELSRNVDGFEYSTFFYKERRSKGGKLVMGPVWDYDLAWRNAGYADAFLPHGWQFTYANGLWSTGTFWRTRLLQDPAFAKEMNERWKVLRNTTLAEDHLLHLIDSTATLLSESQQRNFQTWPIMGQYVWPNPMPIPATYTDEIDTFKQWMHNRLQWMDANMPGHTNPNVTATQSVQAFTSLAAYPVPFTNHLTVTYQQRVAGPVLLEVISPLGRVAIRQQLPKQTAGLQTTVMPDMSQLATGFYLLRLTSPAGTQTVRVQKYSY